MTSKYPALTGKCSNADAIAYIERWHEEAGECSYVDSLMSKELVAWAKGQIKSDVSLDILGAVNYEIKERLEATQKVNALTAEAERKQKWQEAEDARIGQVIGGLNDQIANLNVVLSQQRGQLNERDVYISRLEAKLERIAQLAAEAWLANVTITPEQLKAQLAIK